MSNLSSDVPQRDPLLTTKLYIPPQRAGMVLRPRLVERLNQGLDCRLTVVSAPAGFGKTTLVSEWLAGLERPSAWLSLDEGDNDLAVFSPTLSLPCNTSTPVWARRPRPSSNSLNYQL